MKPVYGARCPITSCARRGLGSWTSLEAAITRVLEHLHDAHKIDPVAVVGLETER